LLTQNPKSNPNPNPNKIQNYSKPQNFEVPKAHDVGLSMRRGSPSALLVPVVHNPRHFPGGLPWVGLLEKLV